MTSDSLILAAAALIGLLVVASASLKGWQDWLKLKTRELETHRPSHSLDSPRGSPEGAARIEISDLKERIRKLEAIAAGVDL
jgi:hypothetical protein